MKFFNFFFAFLFVERHLQISTRWSANGCVTLVESTLKTPKTLEKTRLGHTDTVQ